MTWESPADFLAHVTSLDSAGELDRAVYEVLSWFIDRRQVGDLAACDVALAGARVEVMTEDLMVAFLVAASWTRRKLQQYDDFLRQARETLRGRGVEEAEIEEIFEGLD